MNSRLSAQLAGSRKDDLLGGLQQVLRDQDWEALPAVARLTSFPDAEVAGLALNSALLLAKGILKSRIRTAPKAILATAVSLVRAHSTEFVRNLAAQIDEIDPEVVINAVMASRHFLAPERCSEVIRRMGKTPDHKVRATLVRHLGAVSGRQSPELLTKYLDDVDARVRANALDALSDIADKRHARIVGRFKADPVPRIRANAARALFVLGDRAFLKCLEEMLCMFDKPAMRISAVWTIGEIGKGSRESLALLKAVTEDKSEAIRTHLKGVLDKVGLIPELDYLRGHLKEEIKSQIRSNIIRNTSLKIEQDNRAQYLLMALSGSLTVDTMLSLRFKTQDLEKAGASGFVLDFSSLEFIDSSGAALLSNLSRQLEKKGGFLYVANCNERIRELFQVTGLDYILKIFTTLSDVDAYLS